MTAEPIDRDCELVAMRRALDGAACGLGGLLSIQGPAGIGRSTLLEQLGALARMRGFAVEAVALTPELRSWPVDLLTRAGAASAAQPAVVLIDDLHLGEAGALEALDELARRLDGLHLLVGATVRVGQPGTAAAQLGRILSGPYADVIEPGPLGDRGVDALLHQTFGRPCEAGFVTAAHNVSGGNPLLLRVLADEALALGLRGTAEEGQVLARLAARGIDAILADRRDQAALPAAESSDADRPERPAA